MNLKEKIKERFRSKETQQEVFSTVSTILLTILLLAGIHYWNQGNHLVMAAFCLSPFPLLILHQVLIKGERRVGAILLSFLRLDE